MKRTLLTVLAAAFIVGLPLSAQSGKIDIKHLDKLSDKASEYVEVSLSGLPLKWAFKAMAKEEPEAYEFLKHIKGIYVRVIGGEKNKTFTNEDIEAIKKQISVPPWERMVKVRDGSNADINIFLLVDPKTETLKGLIVLVVDGSELVFVNLVGDFDPDKLDLLEGNFGIPSSVNLGGDKKKNSKKSVAVAPQEEKIAKDGEPDPKPTKEETIGVELGQTRDAI
ncbi:MAG: DUF4252 domain-containing protein [Holophagales bacterium]|jgi:hypothetical protein|nr:DUF4252 domain-containing protein [Holophagales bacterium]